MLSALCLAAGMPTALQAQTTDFTLDQSVAAIPESAPRRV